MNFFDRELALAERNGINSVDDSTLIIPPYGDAVGHCFHRYSPQRLAPERATTTARLTRQKLRELGGCGRVVQVCQAGKIDWQTGQCLPRAPTFYHQERHVGPAPVQNLVGQVEKARRFSRLRS